MATMSPNQPKTQHRSIRVPDERWEAGKAAAAANGTTISAVVNELLQGYIDDSQKPDVRGSKPPSDRG